MKKWFQLRLSRSSEQSITRTRIIKRKEKRNRTTKENKADKTIKISKQNKTAGSDEISSERGEKWNTENWCRTEFVRNRGIWQIGGIKRPRKRKNSSAIRVNSISTWYLGWGRLGLLNWQFGLRTMVVVGSTTHGRVTCFNQRRGTGEKLYVCRLKIINDVLGACFPFRHCVKIWSRELSCLLWFTLALHLAQ